jgi:ADP-ribose pyrophosphatase YjhB (NUDIX family)
MTSGPGLLAAGPWDPDQVHAVWSDDHFELEEAQIAAADAAIAALKERGSPHHDGLSARFVGHELRDGGLHLELQPARWALRLLEGGAEGSMAALCVARDAAGRWLAGRRAAWLASWAGRWALGAGGAVEVGENPAQTLARELREEWSVTPERLRVEALVRLPSGLVMLVGVAHLPDGAEVVPDSEHDAHDWWPADVDAWPDEADEPLRRMGRLLAAAG